MSVQVIVCCIDRLNSQSKAGASAHTLDQPTCFPAPEQIVADNWLTAIDAKRYSVGWPDRQYTHRGARRDHQLETMDASRQSLTQCDYNATQPQMGLEGTRKTPHSELPAMAISITESVDPANWNSRVASLRGPMQLTTEWAAYVCAKHGAQSLFVQNNTNRECLAGIVYLSSSRRWPLSKWPVAWADCTPVTNDETEVLPELERLLRSRRCIEFQLNSFAAISSSPTASMGYIETRREEFVLSLDNSLAVAWNGIRQTMRHDIRRFERSGLACRARTDPDALSAMIAIEADTSHRHRAQGKQSSAMDQGAYSLLWKNGGQAR